MKKYRWNHAMIGAGITVVGGIIGSPLVGAVFIIGIYAGREIVQFFLKKHKFTLDVIVKHLGDVLAAAVGAIPTAVVMILLGL